MKKPTIAISNLVIDSEKKMRRARKIYKKIRRVIKNNFGLFSNNIVFRLDSFKFRDIKFNGKYEFDRHIIYGTTKAKGKTRSKTNNASSKVAQVQSKGDIRVGGKSRAKR